MTLDCRRLPSLDPSPIFELYRGNYASELLVAAVAHFDLFARLANGPQTAGDLGRAIGLAERPTTVLVTALRAMGLLAPDDAGRLDLTPMAREHLAPGQPFYVGDYLAMAASSPGVREMVRRLRTNRPAGSDGDGQEQPGVAFIFRDGIESAMDDEASARRLTLGLAGRAKNVAPALAARVALDDAKLLVDVGGGSGIYAAAMLQRYPKLRAVIFDGAEVLKVAREMAEAYGVSDRLDTVAGDMFRDALPTPCDAILLSNVLHDWDVPACRALVARCAAALAPGGQLLVHDACLDDDLAGPLPVALYSAALFCVCEGRAYSAGEYGAWMREAGLVPGKVEATLIHCSVLAGTKPR